MGVSTMTKTGELPVPTPAGGGKSRASYKNIITGTAS